MKGKTVISLLPLIDIATCVIPEYMHSVLLGVGKQFFHLWFNNSGNWSLKEVKEEINTFVMSIRPPHSFHRMPRSIDLFKFYKASEFLHWILYYSIPSVIDYLPDIYFQHWLLLVIALYNLLQERISISDLEQAEICLRLFVRQIKDLYTEKQYTYNVHQLLHLGLSVRRWGPLWATSAFPFENFNGYLSKCIHGSKHMGQQIINNILITQSSKTLWNEHKNMCDKYNEQVYDIHEGIKFKLLGNIYVMKETIINEIECRLLTLGFCVNNINIYARAQINEDIYTSQIYKITRNNSSTVQVTFNNNTNVYGTIRFFFQVDHNLYFIIQCLSVISPKIIVHKRSKLQVRHILPIEDTEEFVLINIRHTKSICNLIRIGNYICKYPNMLKQVL